MKQETKIKNRAIILLIFTMMFVFLSGVVFSQQIPVQGLSTAGGAVVNCEYNPTTNNCSLPGGTYYIDESIVYLEGKQPNLLIENGNVTLKTCIIGADENATDPLTGQRIIGVNTSACISSNSELYITDFNSIIINAARTFEIVWAHPTKAKMSGQLNISSSSNFEFDNSNLHNVYVTEENYMELSDILLSQIDFSELNINNRPQGNLILKSNTEIYTSGPFWTGKCETIVGDFDLQLIAHSKNLNFGDVNNLGNMEITCGVKVSDEGCHGTTEIIEPICKLKINNLAGNIPRKLRFEYEHIDQTTTPNSGIFNLSTCTNLIVPVNLDYNNLCKLIYGHPVPNFTNLNQSNIGLPEDKILRLVNSCSGQLISNQINYYLFVDYNTIQAKPILFGTISPINISVPITPTFVTNLTNHGIFNFRNQNNRVYPLSHQSNIFFKMYPTTNTIDMNLLDSYFMRFKLVGNTGDINYPDINLLYPFKIYK